jgi:ABC-type multidrug transport system ATPase subunit
MLPAARRTPVRGEDVMLGFYDVGLTKATTPPTRLVADVSGYVVRGGVTAILGASSSGKSIFLKALAGRGNELASLMYSGRAVLDGSAMALLTSGYPVAFVRQDDSGLVGVLTVRETLTVAARLRCKTGVDITARVNDTMQRLGLEPVADGYIGTLLKRGLSGGQKRRVSVGVELVASPK